MRLAWPIPDVGHYQHARLQAVIRSASVDAHFVEAYAESEFAEFRKEDVRDSGYARHALGFSRPARIRDRLGIKRKIRERLDQIDPDVVFVLGWGDTVALSAIGWAVDRRRPIVLACESTRRDFPRARWKEAVKRRVVGLCATGFVGGKAQADYLGSLGMTRERVLEGYAAVDNAHFREGADEARRRAESVRSELGLPDRYFLASGRFVAKKNFSGLIRAYANHLATAGSKPWPLLLLGDGPLRAPLEQLVRELGVGAEVSFRGFQPYGLLPAFYGLAEAFVHASTTEQWGLVVNEAMAAGLPVVVSDRSGCAEDLVADGHNGYLFDPYDPAAFADRLARIASEACDRRSMGQRSRDIVERWSLERWAANLRSAAEQAMSLPTPRASLLDRVLIEALALR